MEDDQTKHIYQNWDAVISDIYCDAEDKRRHMTLNAYNNGMFAQNLLQALQAQPTALLDRLNTEHVLNNAVLIRDFSAQQQLAAANCLAAQVLRDSEVALPEKCGRLNHTINAVAGLLLTTQTYADLLEKKSMYATQTDEQRAAQDAPTEDAVKAGCAQLENLGIKTQLLCVNIIFQAKKCGVVSDETLQRLGKLFDLTIQKLPAQPPIKRAAPDGHSFH